MYCCIHHTDATVTLDSPDYNVDEGAGSVEVCLSLTDIPSDGLECVIEVTLQTCDGVKAGQLNSERLHA